MNKKNNRKGFTIVELVIVIAVIAILATVMVPTFSSVVSNATNAAIKQDAKAIYNSYVAQDAMDGTFVDDCYVKVTRNNTVYYVQIENGAVKGEPGTDAPTVAGTTVVERSGDSYTSTTVPTAAGNGQG